MSFKCFLKGDFSCSGHLKALLGAGVCFNFWHCIICLRLLPAGGTAQAAHLLGRVGIRAAKVGENGLANNNKINPVYTNTFYKPGNGFFMASTVASHTCGFGLRGNFQQPLTAETGRRKVISLRLCASAVGICSILFFSTRVRRKKSSTKISLLGTKKLLSSQKIPEPVA